MQGAGGRGRVQGGWRFFLALLALVALAGCAQAPPGRTASAAMQAGEQVEAPRWRVGSEWRYSDGYGLKVVRTDGAVTTFQRLDDARQWISRRGFIRESSRSSTAERRLLFEALRVAARRVVVAVPVEAAPDPVFGHLQVYDDAQLHGLAARTGWSSRVFTSDGAWLVLDRPGRPARP